MLAFRKLPGSQHHQTDDLDTKFGAKLLLLLGFSLLLSNTWEQPARADLSYQPFVGKLKISQTQSCALKSRINNFDTVSQDFWRGAAPSSQGLEELANMGVKTIIDLRMAGSGVSEEAQQAQRLGLNFHHIPLIYKRPSDLQIAQFLNIINDPAKQPVYVHCRFGSDRTGTMVGVFRVVNQHWQFKETYDEMRQHHFKPWFKDMRRLLVELQDNERKQGELLSLSRSLSKEGQQMAQRDKGNLNF
jgi:protein tyrosine phosphatase (PTP) superfamily phosphohydrolase (DUF442 family)